MYAEDVIEVDVPFAQTASTIIVARIEVFDPNSGWMDVGHDLQIRVLTAYAECNRVSYRTEVRATSGSIQGLDFCGPSDFAAIETQLLDSDYVQRLVDFPYQYANTSQGSDCVVCWGYTGAVSVGAIRHRIAVRPVEVEISFELKNIPVPSVEPVAKWVMSKGVANLSYSAGDHWIRTDLRPAVVGSRTSASSSARQLTQHAHKPHALPANRRYGRPYRSSLSTCAL